MDLFGKFKEMIGVNEEDFEDDMEILTQNDNKRNDIDSKPIINATSPHVPKSNKVVNIHATTQLQVILVKPDRFEDASSVADHLNSKRTVVLNLESTNKETSRRLIDFLSGVAYANNGQIKRVAN
jgi:cell division inhibitor SepF